MKIALLGAESTGKTQLAADLAAHLRGRGRTVAVVDEVLREWCARAGRTPRPQEQLPIAQEQERRVDAAVGVAEVVIADTTALMVAIYSAMLFEDGSLYRFALDRLHHYDHILVTGLDLAWVPDGLQRDGPHVREPVDGLIRAALRRAAVPFQVVYGSGPERLAAALRALENASAPVDAAATADVRAAAAVDALTAPTADTGPGWRCERCSDPACEHRLFSGLF